MASIHYTRTLMDMEEIIMERLFKRSRGEPVDPPESTRHTPFENIDPIRTSPYLWLNLFDTERSNRGEPPLSIAERITHVRNCYIFLGLQQEALEVVSRANIATTTANLIIAEEIEAMEILFRRAYGLPRIYNEVSGRHLNFSNINVPSTNLGGWIHTFNVVRLSNNEPQITHEEVRHHTRAYNRLQNLIRHTEDNIQSGTSTDTRVIGGDPAGTVRISQYTRRYDVREYTRLQFRETFEHTDDNVQGEKRPAESDMLKGLMLTSHQVPVLLIDGEYRILSKEIINLIEKASPAKVEVPCCIVCMNNDATMDCGNKCEKNMCLVCYNVWKEKGDHKCPHCRQAFSQRNTKSSVSAQSSMSTEDNSLSSVAMVD